MIEAAAIDKHPAGFFKVFKSAIGHGVSSCFDSRIDGQRIARQKNSPSAMRERWGHLEEGIDPTLGSLKSSATKGCPATL